MLKTLPTVRKGVVVVARGELEIAGRQELARYLSLRGYPTFPFEGPECLRRSALSDFDGAASEAAS
jgi:hypothetical protein